MVPVSFTHLILLFIFNLQGEALNVNADEFIPRSANENSISGSSSSENINLGGNNNICHYCLSSFVGFLLFFCLYCRAFLLIDSNAKNRWRSNLMELLATPQDI